MADKEATVFIVDVGKSMNERHQSRSETDLEWALKYVWDRITSTVATERKTLLQAVIGLRTDETSNDLQHDPDFGTDHISVFQELDQILLPNLRQLKEQLVPSNTDHGDAITAIVVAIKMIMEKCKKLKYKKRIILVTNSRGRDLDADQLSDIGKKLEA